MFVFGDVFVCVYGGDSGCVGVYRGVGYLCVCVLICVCVQVREATVVCVCVCAMG